MFSSEETCEKWYHVNFTADSEPICGTLFLLSLNSDDTVIQWIADSGNLLEAHVPPKIPLSNVSHVSRRRLVFGRNHSSIFFQTNQNEIFGPFEFTRGSSRQFIDKLKSYVDLQRVSSQEEVYKVIRKTTTYQLPTSDFSNSPMSAIQSMGTRLINAFESLRVNTDVAPNENTTPWRFSPDAEGFLDPSLGAHPLIMEQKHVNQLLPAESFTSITVPGDGDYQLISRAPLPITIPDLRPVPRKHALTLDDWRRHLDVDGRVTVVEKLKNSIYNGGIEPGLRSTVWKYLFGYFKWDFTEVENAERVEEKHRHYHIMKKFWKSMTKKQIENSRAFRERRSIIEKDTSRTDRQTALFRDNSTGALTRLYNILMTYTFYNPDLGYLQGMNDLLAVIMTVVDGEEDAFWCFAGLLDRISGHFSDGPSSLLNQFTNLFKLIEILMPRFAQYLREKEATSMSFCFKWFLIIFKREFSYDDIKILWETLYSGAAPKNFQLLIAVAIFDAEADTIMRSCSDISQILKYINGLSEKINLQNVLSRAQGIYNQLLEVKDRLPNEVAICLGFTSLATDSGDGCHANVNDSDLIPVVDACEFSLETAAVASPPLSSPSGLETGEDALTAEQHCVQSVTDAGNSNLP